jgi:nucleoside-diphosphate-sugar epimerase
VTIAITGATGFVGQALLDLALERGLAVRALARQQQAPRQGVEWVAGDLADHAALARLVEGAEAVVHVAGVVNAPDPAGFEAGNVTGTLAVVEAAMAAGVPRLVHVSSLSAREPELSVYGASKLRGERIVQASALDWTIVRPPGIYGPRDRDIFELFRAARWGVIPVPPKDGRLSVIHVHDLAALLLALLPGGEAVTSKLFEPDDGKRGGWRHKELARAIGWAMGKRVLVLSLSPAMLGRAARFDTWLRRGKAKMTQDRASYFSHPDWVSSTQARVPASVWKPWIATRDGLRMTADWYREAGWL